MNVLLYLLFIFLFGADYFLSSVSIGKLAGWIPEILSGLVFLVVCAHFTRYRDAILPTRYIIFFTLFFMLLIVGVVANEMQPGAVFAGVRKYFRYTPFFLLPIVYQFSEIEIKKIIKLLFLFSLFQLPVVIYQKLVIFKYKPTGDVIEGTIIGSGKMAVYSICVISIVLAYYLKGRISLKLAALFIAIMFVPIGLTEASAALFLMPIIFLVPILFMKRDQLQVKRLSTLSVVGVVTFTSFILVYNMQYSSRWDGNILNAIIKGQVFENLYRGTTDTDSVRFRISGNKMEEVSRVDSMILPLKYLYNEGLVNVLYGVGIGNASDSFSKVLQGEYYWTIDEKNSDITTIGNMLWEIGIIGVFMSIIILLMVFFDAKKLQSSNGSMGAVALGWLGVTFVILLTMPYTNILSHNIFGYVMWFFLGLIISQANSYSNIKM